MPVAPIHSSLIRHNGKPPKEEDMDFRKLSIAVAAAAGALAAQPALAQFKTQGITDTEIVIGTHMDLSGPIKSWGVPSTNGMKLAIDQINARGGINGRKLRLV